MPERSGMHECVADLRRIRPIARGRFVKQEETGKQLRTNERIRISPIRLIDEENNQVGIVEIQRALNMAREAGLDLVEVAPNVRPPVCRIMDYGKWKYQQKKKESKNKANSKHNELKEIRVRPKTDHHDMMIKVNKATEFLKDGNKVQFTMMFKGRELAHQDLGMDILKQLAEQLDEISKVEVPPRRAHRRMTMIIAPDTSSKKEKKKEADTPEPNNA